MKQKSKKYTPGGLPFLQAQVLEHIYLNIIEGKKTEIGRLSEITDYPTTSKILSGAIDSLVNKDFISGSLNSDFSIPEHRYDFFQKVIKRHNYNNKNYSGKICNHFEKKSSQLNLFLKKRDIGELNKYGIIHKWYNYLEEFPPSLIEKKIFEYKLKKGFVIVDPFCGSGTTLISSNMFGMDAIGFDVSHLMVFVSTVKTTWDINLIQLKEILFKVAGQFLQDVKKLDEIKFDNSFLKLMPKKELNQWLSPRLQKEVVLLKNIIIKIPDVKIRNLLLLAMSKSCFDASYVALCPGTTFYPFREKEDFWNLFSDKAIQMYEDLKAIERHDSYGKSKLIADTCLNVKDYLEPNSVDFIITSPPYPNDLEYTRQTRLELYLLDFVKSMDDIQKIKRKMVKSSTKLIYKESSSARFIEKFPEIMECSAKVYEQTKNKNWGFDYPRMVREYFGDMYLCMKEFYPILKNNSHFLLVVGDQTIKGVLIPVGEILISIAKEIGYKNCHKELFRIRRSTGHNIPLPEEIVSIEK